MTSVSRAQLPIIPIYIHRNETHMNLLPSDDSSVYDLGILFYFFLSFCFLSLRSPVVTFHPFCSERLGGFFYSYSVRLSAVFIMVCLSSSAPPSSALPRVVDFRGVLFCVFTHSLCLGETRTYNHEGALRYVSIPQRCLSSPCPRLSLQLASWCQSKCNLTIGLVDGMGLLLFHGCTYLGSSPLLRMNHNLSLLLITIFCINIQL